MIMIIIMIILIIILIIIVIIHISPLWVRRERARACTHHVTST